MMCSHKYSNKVTSVVVKAKCVIPFCQLCKESFTQLVESNSLVHLSVVWTTDEQKYESLLREVAYVKSKAEVIQVQEKLLWNM